MFCAPVAVAPIWLPSPAASSSRACPIGKPRAIPPPRGVATAFVGALTIARRTAHYGDHAGPLIAVGVAVSARVLRRAADTDSASSQRLVENLQRQVARWVGCCVWNVCGKRLTLLDSSCISCRLQEANSQLQAEVLAAKAGLGVPTEDAEQART